MSSDQFNLSSPANSSHDNFFGGFSEWNEFKWMYVVFQVVMIFIGPALLYSIVWYENYLPNPGEHNAEQYLLHKPRAELFIQVKYNKTFSMHFCFNSKMSSTLSKNKFTDFIGSTIASHYLKSAKF